MLEFWYDDGETQFSEWINLNEWGTTEPCWRQIAERERQNIVRRWVETRLGVEFWLLEEDEPIQGIGYKMDAEPDDIR